MCGIAGLWRFDGEPVDHDRLVGMSRALAHRGPDGEGIWARGSIGLAHRRLAIVDLSETGAQPMASADGALIVTFNGEIYNYQDLRRELEIDGVAFRSTSDTEVLLYLYARHGENMLAKLRGMFAFALWDAARERLFFARDRLGKKPFFYRHDERAFAFASEIKALTVDERPAIDLQAMRLFLGLQYVPAPLSGFVGIKNLPPAHAGTVEARKIRLWRYDDFPRTPKFVGSFDEAVTEVRRLLTEAIRLRLIADVPVGAFLSGGIDSSAIAALMARESQQPIQTFTMGFPALGFDERGQAREFAKQLGAAHHEFEAQPARALELVDTLVDLYDAPYADSSALPTWLLARETRHSVKAVMTGDGADELFGGYRRYGFFAQAIWLERYAGIAAEMFERFARRVSDPRVQRFVRTVRALERSMGEGYATLFTGAYFSPEDEPSLLQPDFARATQASVASQWIAARVESSLGVEAALDFDLSSYLPDDLNVKMDRATMAHGLEARAPFLDQELVRFATRLPLSFSLKHGKSKRVLRAALKGLVPDEILRRRKRGFQVPLAAWFRGDLRTAFQERCLASVSPLGKFCQPKEVQRCFDENARGVDHGNRLWMLMVLATWLERQS